MTGNTYKRVPSLVKSLRTEPDRCTRGRTCLTCAIAAASARHRKGEFLLEQQVWTACYSSLVHAGWSSLMVSWHLHSWFNKTIPHRGWFWVAKELKVLSTLIRAAALRAPYTGEAPLIPKRIIDALSGMASKSPLMGFAFSRLSRGLPLPPQKVVEEATIRAVAVSKDHRTTSGAVLDQLRHYITSSVKARGYSPKFRSPGQLPVSNSSCFEWPATRGGIDGYLRELGHACESGMWPSGFPITGVIRRRHVAHLAQDSLGTFCLKKAEVILAPERGPVSDNLDESYRCAGVLALRLASVDNNRCRLKLECIRSPGLKARVISVPDALTYIEGSWIRMSCPMLPRKHWPVQTGPDSCPTRLRYRPHRGGMFASVDLTAATDGLHHDVVEVVVDSLRAAGLIRDSDMRSATRSLGVGPQARWFCQDRSPWFAVRGSPMGTPLSFVVLCWVNAWATSAFTHSAVHGDDGVGYFKNSYEFEEYCDAVASVGSSVNRGKTFISSTSWTMCEVFYGPRGNGKGADLVSAVPSCPPPGLEAPIACPAGLSVNFQRKSERVMRILFPWFSKVVQAHLPVCINGFGYLGRGLAVSVGVRSRLGALVSRNVDTDLALAVNRKDEFREEGLYPRALVPIVDPKLVVKARKAVKSYGLRNSEGDAQVPLDRFVTFESNLVQQEYRLLGGSIKRKSRNEGRQLGQGRSNVRLFRRYKGKPAPPLSKRHGAAAITRFMDRVKSVPVRVDQEIAFEILGEPQSS